jgi:tRNA(Phe) wybutosine-synthesizing methylase Tyw3
MHVCIYIYRILAIHTKRSGAESQDVASENNNIAIVHYNVSEKLPYGVRKNEQICIAEKYAKEAVRISTKINGPSHPQTMKYKTLLSNPRSRFQYSPY